MAKVDKTQTTRKFVDNVVVTVVDNGITKTGTVVNYTRGKYTVKIGTDRLRLEESAIKIASPAEVKAAEKAAKTDKEKAPEKEAATAEAPKEVDKSTPEAPAKFVPIASGTRVCATLDDGNAMFGEVIDYKNKKYVVNLPDIGLIELPVDQVEEIEAEEEEESAAGTEMARALAKARKRYRAVVKSSGTKSADCGDGLALAMQNLEPLEVAALADEIMNQSAGYHGTRYGKLNAGQIRMNSGNRIRAHYKKMMSEGNVDEVNRIRSVLGMESL